jgi:hypothetical protein
MWRRPKTVKEPFMEKTNAAAVLAGVPRPHPMPVDAAEYARALSPSGFLNAYYQLRDVLSYRPRRVLVVGVGVGLEPLVLREKFGVEVTTLDVDARFGPDVVGSVHDMAAFADRQFDVVVASHVLEHLPFAYFDQSVDELARVARHAVVYLPFAGRHLELKLTYAQRVREWAARLRLPPLARITGNEPCLQEGHHYWEVGYRGFSPGALARRFERRFTIDRRYHNRDWAYSINFLMTAKVGRA